MAQSIRFVLRGQQGRTRHNFNWPGVISARSVVHISAGEVQAGTTQIQQVPPTQDFFYHLGEASVWVSNVSPHKNEFSGEAGGVEFHTHVDFNSPIDIAVTITVEDELPVEIQGF